MDASRSVSSLLPQLVWLLLLHTLQTSEVAFAKYIPWKVAQSSFIAILTLFVLVFY